MAPKAYRTVIPAAEGKWRDSQRTSAAEPAGRGAEGLRPCTRPDFGESDSAIMSRDIRTPWGAEPTREDTWGPFEGKNYAFFIPENGNTLLRQDNSPSARRRPCPNHFLMFQTRPDGRGNGGGQGRRTLRRRSRGSGGEGRPLGLAAVRYACTSTSNTAGTTDFGQPVSPGPPENRGGGSDKPIQLHGQFLHPTRAHEHCAQTSASHRDASSPSRAAKSSIFCSGGGRGGRTIVEGNLAYNLGIFTEMA